jgi:hypothetical protein
MAPGSDFLILLTELIRVFSDKEKTKINLLLKGYFFILSSDTLYS